MNLERALEVIRAACAGQELEVRRVPIDDTFVSLPPESLHMAVQALFAQGEQLHLSTITGMDTGGGIELLYHFWLGHGLTLCTTLPLQGARIRTLTDLVPGALFYEREASEMLGITFEGHPDPARLLLPDDWSGTPPLRKKRRGQP